MPNRDAHGRFISGSASGIAVEPDPSAIAAYLRENAEALLGPGAELIAGRQAERAPRDPHSSEHMADHIVVDFHDGVADVGPEKRFFYAAFVEHGTEKMEAEPFIRPSVDG